MKTSKLSLGSSTKPTTQRTTYELNKLRVQASNASKQLQRQVAAHETKRNYYNSSEYKEQQSKMFKPLIDRFDEQSEILRNITR